MEHKNKKNSRRKSQMFHDLAQSQEALQQNEQLQILYQNKNFQPPPQRDYETIFEAAKRGLSLDGSLELGKSLARRAINPYRFWKQDDRERIRRRKAMIQKQFKGRSRPRGQKLTAAMEEELARLLRDKEEEQDTSEEEDYEHWLDTTLDKCLRRICSGIWEESRESSSRRHESSGIDCSQPVPPEVYSCSPVNLEANPAPNFGICATESLSSRTSEETDLVNVPQEWMSLIDSKDLLFCHTDIKHSGTSTRSEQRMSIVRSVRRSARFISEANLAGSVFAEEEMPAVPEKIKLAARTPANRSGGSRNKENKRGRRWPTACPADCIESRLEKLALTNVDLNMTEESVTNRHPVSKRPPKKKPMEALSISEDEEFPVFSPVRVHKVVSSQEVASTHVGNPDTSAESEGSGRRCFQSERLSNKDECGQRESEEGERSPVGLSGRRSCEVDISLPSCVRRSLTGEFLPSRPLYEGYSDSNPEQQQPRVTACLPWSDSDEEETMITGTFEKKYLGLPQPFHQQRGILNTAHVEDSFFQ